MSHPLKVLVVDDDAANQILTCKQLTVLGCRAEAVGDAERALDAVARRKFDILLLDCQLPGMGGPELAAEIRRRGRSGPRPLVIGICGGPSEAHRARCLAAGMDEFWSKPISIAAMGDRLMALTGRDLRDEAEAGCGDSAAVKDRSEDDRLDPAALAALDRLAGAAGENVRRQVIEPFLDDLATRIKAIERALDAGDLSALADLTHPLISASAIVGASGISTLCAAIEARARASEEHSAVELARTLLERSRLIAITLHNAIRDR